MADLKMYNNGENKILFSAGDRIIRQSYEFENGIFATLPSNYVQFNIAGLIEGDFTIMGFTRILDTEGNKSIVALFSDESHLSDNQVFAIGTPGASNNIGCYALGVENYFSMITVPILSLDLIFFAFSYNSTTNEFIYVVNNQIKTGTKALGQNRSFLVFRRNYIIGWSRLFTNVLNGDINVFSRYLPLHEIMYYRSNMQGSEVQTRNNLVMASSLSRAEILQIEGNDRIAVFDRSGNDVHGEIFGIPAGTLQEQLDWANENLFVPFIS